MLYFIGDDIWQTGAAAAATFSLAWTKPLPYPYEPMAMGVVAHADTVVLGKLNHSF